MSDDVARPRFTDEQQQVINAWGQGVAVLAGAGSGKTTTLVEKCRVLLERNPQARFIAVSFTERSAQDLDRKLARAGCLESEGGLNWVTTIHGLCGSILREFPREAGLEGGERVFSEQEARLFWERALEDLWSESAPPEVQAALQVLWEREGRAKLEKLLLRVRDIEGFGVLDRFQPGNDSESLQVAARFVLERYQRYKLREGGLDFGDLERFAVRALENLTVQQTLRDRFDLVLGDEFQDTNLVQSRILRAIARPELVNLVIVGDPKQSIYRFRDADVSLFEEFCAELPLLVSLTRNFRSLPPIIEFVNRACEVPFQESGLSYVPLVPGRAALQATPAVVRLDVAAPTDDDITLEAHGARVLAQWLRSPEGQAIAWSDSILLLRGVRSGSGGRWLQGLIQAGVPLAVASGGFFWKDPRVAELVALLKWGESEGNRLAAAVALRAPWMGVPDGVLDRWCAEAQELRMLPWSRLQEFDPAWKGAEIARALAELLAVSPASVRPAQILEPLLAIPGEMSSVALGLWHRLEEWSGQGLGYSAILREVERAIDEERREADLPPPEQEGAGVLRVLTVHGSKGLEFKRVILVDFGAKSRSGESPLLFWDRNRGAFLAGRGPDGERQAKDPDEKQWREWEQQQELAELKRVFYVALTRAQEQLVLVTAALSEKAQPAPWRQWVDQPAVEQPLLEGMQRCAIGDEGAPAQSMSASASEVLLPAPAKKSARRRPRHSVSEWLLLERCERAYSARFFLDPTTVPAEPARKDRPKGHSPALAGRDAAQLGTEVHAVLERASLGDDGWEAQLRGIADEFGAQRVRTEEIARWIRDRESKCEPGVEVYPELAFEINLAALHDRSSLEVLVGSIDRLEVGPREIRILDYKVTSGKKKPEAIAELYRSQLELYAWSVRQLLGAEAEGKRWSACIVEITPQGVREIPVAIAADAPSAQRLPRELLKRAQQALARGDIASSPARGGSHCASCGYRPQCVDAATGI